jgi:uncharacterized Rmd1/YagE family protein
MHLTAINVGEKFNLKKIPGALEIEPKFRDPMIFSYPKNRYAVFHSYGVVVLWNFSVHQSAELLKKINPYIIDPVDVLLNDEIDVISGKTKNVFKDDRILLSEITLEKIAIISMIISRSVALEFVEKEAEKVQKDFDTIITQFAEKGRYTKSTRGLLKKVGQAMKIQHMLVGSMAMLDKPDIAWEDSGLDSFYNELKKEYEIDERYLVLNEKLKIVFHNVDFILGLIEAKRNFMLEFVIGLMIFVEIVIFVWDILR